MIMIRGNEKAIDLGLSILECVSPSGTAHSIDAITDVCNAAREIVGGAAKPITKQDLWYVQQRALWKLQRAALKRVGILRAEISPLWDGKNFRGLRAGVASRRAA